MTMRFLGLTGSLRHKSTNKGLLRAAKANLPNGVTMKCADLSDVPFYNSDLVEKPGSVQSVLEQIAHANALVLACPEYNYSIAPALKNILDWASREQGNALLAGKSVAIMGAGGGMGSSRAQYHLRQVCVMLDLKPLNKPEIFSNANSKSFDAEGNVVDEALIRLVSEQMQRLADQCRFA